MRYWMLTVPFWYRMTVLDDGIERRGCTSKSPIYFQTCHENLSHALLDAELRVRIDNRFKSMGAEPYLGYEMRAMR